ncbi:MAG: hypothetical protein Q4F69_02490 [Bacteroidia bacterium]|nr:hypothetical protein [Bacteroidia bacterium]
MAKKANAEKAQNAAANEAAAKENGVINNEAAQATPTAEPATEQPQTVGEVVKNILDKEAETRREIERRQAELDKRLEDLERMKELCNHRQKFIETDKALEKALGRLDGDEFTNPHFRILLKDVEQYGDKGEVVAISNTDLIREFVLMLRSKIAAKVEEIETELMS